VVFSVIGGGRRDGFQPRVAPRDAINTDTSPQAASFVAAAEGAQLVVVNRDGTQFATSFEITRSSARPSHGRPRRRGGDHRAGLANGQTATLVLISQAGATPFAYTAAREDSRRSRRRAGRLIDANAATPDLGRRAGRDISLLAPTSRSATSRPRRATASTTKVTSAGRPWSTRTGR